jgi:hypothetical protein
LMHFHPKINHVNTPDEIFLNLRFVKTEWVKKSSRFFKLLVVHNWFKIFITNLIMLKYKY